MNQIYYHLPTKTWYHNQNEVGLLLGKNEIPFKGSRKPTSLPFFVSKNKKKLGPLVGILVGSAPNKDTFIGNIPTLRRLLLSLEKKGSIGIVLTPSSLKDNYCEGYLYYSCLKNWVHIRTPYPDVVYNRVPFRQMETSFEFMQTVERLKRNQIPFFNPRFFTKWETYQFLNENLSLKTYLPDTILLIDKKSIEIMLNKYQIVYIKSSSGYKGLGIYQLCRGSDGICLQTIKTSENFRTIDDMWNAYKGIFRAEEFIIQQGIDSDQYDGKRYDLRLLCHFHQGSYIISGIGARLAERQQVTTHVPNGGSILSFEAIKERIDEDLINKIVAEIGEQLSNQIGEFIGEFSVDLGRTKDGFYYIYEINSKPMVFDEPAIQERGLENLTELLIMKGMNS